jgi:hypothetical protein
LDILASGAALNPHNGRVHNALKTPWKGAKGKRDYATGQHFCVVEF